MIYFRFGLSVRKSHYYNRLCQLCHPTFYQLHIRAPVRISLQLFPQLVSHINAYIFYRHLCQLTRQPLGFRNTCPSSYQASQRSSRLHAPPVRLLPAPDREPSVILVPISPQPSHTRKRPSISNPPTQLSRRRYAPHYPSLPHFEIHYLPFPPSLGSITIHIRAPLPPSSILYTLPGLLSFHHVLHCVDNPRMLITPGHLLLAQFIGSSSPFDPSTTFLCS